MVKKVKSVLHGVKEEGEPSPSFTLYYEAGLPQKIVKDILIPKPGFYGKMTSTRRIVPPEVRLKNSKLFYESLEDSVRKVGFRNPILCWYIPEGLFCIYGTSRMYIARILNRDIPAFVLDFREDFPGQNIITTEKEALSKFHDSPEEFVFEKGYFNYVNERWPDDPVVRKANDLPQHRLTNTELTAPGSD